MGIGYAVSPLHRMTFADLAAIPESADAQLADLIPQGFRATPWNEIEKHLYSPAIPDIVAWRTKLSEKYHDQLLEPLIWNENSAFETSEDVSTHADAPLRYVAAVLDRQGAAETAKTLLGHADIPAEEIRNFIRHTEPSAIRWTPDRGDPPTVLGQVWQCGDTVYRLAVTATRQHLPLWTTG